MFASLGKLVTAVFALLRAWFAWTGRVLAALARLALSVSRSRFVTAPARLAFRLAGSTTRAALTGAVLALLALAILWGGFVRVPVAAIGVRQSLWGGGGIVERDFAPGIWRSTRGLDAWHFLDGRTHFLCFGWQSDGADLPLLDLRTKDGNEVKLGVTVPYRIKPGEGWQLVRDGLKASYRALARTTTRSALMQELAELTSSDFTNTVTRQARCRDALPKLNALLAPYHLEAESVQIHQMQFWAEYEKKLQASQLTKQQTLEVEAATEVEEERRSHTLAQEIDAEEKSLRAEKDKEIESVVATATLEIAKIRADAKSYDELVRAAANAELERVTAEGNLAVAKAEALREELVQKVHESAGGRILLARTAAEKLRIRSVTLDSRDPRVPNPLDLDAMVGLLVGKAK
jgi:regulator of protease activity HflC (stomatin/prohibitin superfamily)